MWAYCLVKTVKEVVVQVLLLGSSVSEEVLKHRAMVEKYAKESDITEYVPILLAIIQVESGGTMEDVMQSSESAGLPPNSLSTEASIKQGCLYFASLVKRSKELGCDQDSIIQAYNFGGGYLDYVAKNGKKHSFALAESFQRKNLAVKKSITLIPSRIRKMVDGAITMAICFIAYWSSNT